MSSQKRSPLPVLLHASPPPPSRRNAKVPFSRVKESSHVNCMVQPETLPTMMAKCWVKGLSTLKNYLWYMIQATLMTRCDDVPIEHASDLQSSSSLFLFSSISLIGGWMNWFIRAFFRISRELWRRAGGRTWGAVQTTMVLRSPPTRRLFDLHKNWCKSGISSKSILTSSGRGCKLTQLIHTVVVFQKVQTPESIGIW